MLGPPGRPERIVCLPRDILPGGSWSPWRQWATAQVAAWKRKRDTYLTSLSSHPLTSCQCFPLARPTQRPVLTEPKSPSCDTGQGQGWARYGSEATDIHHRAGKTLASKVHSDACYACWLGLRAGLPEMSLGHTFKGYPIGIFLGVGSISVPQFPPPLCSGLSSRAYSRSPLKSFSSLSQAEVCHWPRDKPLSPLVALGLPWPPPG